MEFEIVVIKEILLWQELECIKNNLFITERFAHTVANKDIDK